MKTKYRVCAQPNCPTITTTTYCTDHTKQRSRSPSSKATAHRKYKQVRVKILQRDQYTCKYCGELATQVDHITPVSAGGSNAETNLVAACARCNSSKGAR